ncbi:unnamed protein product [Urochloa humidicola]
MFKLTLTMIAVIVMTSWIAVMSQDLAALLMMTLKKVLVMMLKKVLMMELANSPESVCYWEVYQKL